MDGAPENLSQLRKILLDEPGPVLPKLGEHPGFGDENRIDRHATLGGRCVPALPKPLLM